jgi:drug/metabolite transporter (DMT)-like permease
MKEAHGVQAHQPNNLPRAALLMVLSGAAFTAMNALSKSLTLELPVLEVAWLRLLGTMVLIAPYAWLRGIPLLGTHHKLLALRGLIGSSGLCLGFYALSRISLAETTVLWKTSALFAPVLAWIWFKQRPSLRLMQLIALGFIGVIMVLQPSALSVSLGSLAALTSGLTVAVVGLTIRQLQRLEHNLTIIMAFSLWGSLAVGILCLVNGFVVPSASLVPAIAAVAVIGTFGQLCFTKAFAYAAAPRVQPFGYTEVLMSLIWSSVQFGEYLSVPQLFGAALIVLSGLLLIWLKH